MPTCRFTLPSHLEEVAQAANVQIIAKLPIDPAVAAMCDAGHIEEVSFKEMPDFLDAFLQVVPAKVSN